MEDFLDPFAHFVCCLRGVLGQAHIAQVPIQRRDGCHFFFPSARLFRERCVSKGLKLEWTAACGGLVWVLRHQRERRPRGHCGDSVATASNWRILLAQPGTRRRRISIYPSKPIETNGSMLAEERKGFV